MNRDAVLLTLALALCGPLTWLSAWASDRLARAARRPQPDGGERPGSEMERGSWLRLWLPLAPPAIALALLAGWALQEPRQTDEILRPLAPLCVLPAALVVLRAVWRAVRALVPPSVAPLAATVGIVRPRVVLHPRLGEILDAAACDAARAHERAHARHRDPLRIWLAQIATDLQWPAAAASRRLAAWSNALELARDEEARREGVAGEDLASAVVSVAGLTPRSARPAALAQLTHGERSLIHRVRRLLAPLPAEAARGGSRRILARSATLAIGLAAAAAGLALGFEYGDAFVRALPLIAG